MLMVSTLSILFLNIGNKKCEMRGEGIKIESSAFCKNFTKVIIVHNMALEFTFF